MVECEFNMKLTEIMKDVGVPLIAYEEIVIGEQIGQGGYGKVYKGTYKDHNIAIKEMISLDCKHTEGKDILDDITDIINEIKVMLVANNEKFPKFFGVVCRDSIYLIFELIKGVTLKSLYSGLNKTEKLDVVYQLCDVLESLAVQKIIHRDIKPDNIMIEEGNKLRLIDFGIARILSRTVHFTRNKKMTTAYMPPEVVKPQNMDSKTKTPFAISPKLDVWSCGCILSEIFSGIIPWNNICKNNMAISRALITDKEFPVPENIEEDVKEIIKKACVNDPANRISAGEMKEMIGKIIGNSMMVD